MDTTKLLSPEERAILPRIMAQLELDDHFLKSLPLDYAGIVRSMLKKLPEAYSELLHHYDSTKEQTSDSPLPEVSKK